MSNNEALDAFLQESDENIAALEQELLGLEQDPDNADRIARAFRAVHTIKGTSAFFGLNRLEALTHKAEDLMALLRRGEIRLNLEMVGVLLETVDAVRSMLAEIRRTGTDGEQDYGALGTRLDALRTDDAGPGLSGQTQAPPEEGSPTTPADTGINENSIRVDVELLDKLMNLVGELVLVRNQFLQQTASEGGRQLNASSQRLNVVTSELQEGLMKARMQPISTLWAVYPRLFRDLEQQTGKKLRLEREGGTTELDRTLLQAVKDPLTHLVRNAVDHGIEPPAQRAAAGKPEQGRVQLRATHQSGNVIVEIADDGRGIDPEALVEKALQEGLITTERASRLSEREKLELLFLPGLSTAAQVSNLSGRGVGMDVVKANVERIGGNIEIQTTPGKGSVFRVKIPLTLAIISALVATCGGERFAVPQANVLEIVGLGDGKDGRGMEYVHGVPVYRLRGRLLPLVDLRTVLGQTPREDSDASRFVLVLRTDERDYGLIVDDVHDTEEIVVKPLGTHFKDIRCFAGATIMGDGCVALILDARATAEYARLVTEGDEVAGADGASDTPDAPRETDAILVFTPDRGVSRAGIPLTRVARLEEFSRTDIEFSAGREVIQYRGGILPLIRLDRFMGMSSADAGDELLQVVVHSTGEGDIGLVVGSILDIIEEEVGELRRTEGQPHLLGSAVLNGRVTDLVDTAAVVATQLSGVASPAGGEAGND